MTAWEFGPYRVESLIARGGMGEVHRAYDTRHDRTVALKVLPERYAADPVFQARFKRESQVVARLNEPHVIPIHAYGEIGGRLYLDMRLVDGRDVAHVLAEQGPMPPERAVSVVEQLAGALDAAHAAGLIHRDIKPSNALMTREGFVYLVDFGIAGALAASTTTGGSGSLTGTGSTVGTIDYMAPERIAPAPDRPVDHRVDVYALACLLYECLTGSKPFAGAEPAALMFAHVHAERPRPSELRPGLPPVLDEVVAIGMARHPDVRHASAGALAAAARHALTAPAPGRGGLPTVSAAPVPPPPPPPREQPVAPAFAVRPPDPAPRRRGALVAAVAAAAVIAVAGTLVAVNLGGEDGSSAQGGTETTAPAEAGESAEPSESEEKETASESAPPPSSSPPAPTESESEPEPEPETSEPPPPSRAPGDLGLDVPVSTPACDGRYIVLVGAAVEPGRYPQRVRALLAANSGADYLYAPDSCGSLAKRDAKGNDIYAVYRGPYADKNSACAEKARAGSGAYVKRLSDTAGPGAVEKC